MIELLGVNIKEIRIVRKVYSILSMNKVES